MRNLQQLCSDFYVERVGDRSVNFTNITYWKGSEESSGKAYDEFFSKIKEGVVSSFYQRCAQCDSANSKPNPIPHPNSKPDRNPNSLDQYPCMS
jgi:hypothetical protein